MHSLSIDAWIRELEPRSRSRSYSSSLRDRKRLQPDTGKNPRLRKKTNRLVLCEIGSNDQNMDMPSPQSSASRPKRSIEKKRIRTPSLSKNARQFPDDAYSPDDINDATPRQDRSACSAYPIPNLSYKEALSNEPVVEDNLQARSSTRSQTQSQSSNRSASPKKITSLWNVGSGVTYTHLANTITSQREQLGENGFALLEKLEDVGDGPVVPARLKQQLAEADMGKVKQHQFDTSDKRPVDELLWEFRTIQDITSLSHRCSVNRDHETEWNNRVHTKVLELALGNDETDVGFRSVTAVRITPEYRPTHSNNLATGKIVDYAIHLEPSGSARDIISSLVGMSTDSINHVGYEGLCARPIAISIETKTEGRTVEEAKVQLGVWVAAQVARIEALAGQLSPPVVKKPGADAWSGQVGSEMVTRGRERPDRLSRVERSQTQEATPSPTVMMVPGASNLLSQTVFPLIDIQSEAWSLFFARVMPANALHLSKSLIRKPGLAIQIFHSVPLGNTANMVQTYRLLKSLKVLREWVDEDFRKWWDKLLGIREAEGGSQ